jgi:hypothetical protein
MCLGIPMQVAARSAWRGEGAGPSLSAETRVCAARQVLGPLKIGHA